MILWISFYLDGLLSNFSFFHTWIPLFSFVSLFLLVPKYYKRPISFLTFCSILGILLDLCYTNQFGKYLFFTLLWGILLLFFQKRFPFKIIHFLWQFFLFSVSYGILFSQFSFAFIPQNVFFFIICYPFYRIPIKSIEHTKLFRI